MQHNIHTVTYNEKTITIVATAHVSKESAQLVKDTIELIEPDSICIELDSDRYASITSKKKWEDTNIRNVIKEKKVLYLIINVILSSYQKKMAKQTDSPVGQEMIVGIEESKRLNAHLTLADRNIQLTFKRIWALLTFKEKLKLFWMLLFSKKESEIDETAIAELLTDTSIENSISSLKTEFPTVGQVLLDERDQYLAYKIKNSPGNKIVAILGAAHVPGVKKEIFKDQNINELTYIPVKKRSKYYKWIIPGLIILLFVYALYSNIDKGLVQIGTWMIYNSSFAALFTALSLAHPVSILIAFISAPFSAIHPLVACGWFVALYEAKVKKPTVKDAQSITEDISSVKGFFSNRITRILFSMLMANLGSIVGTLISSLDLVKNLF